MDIAVQGVVPLDVITSLLATLDFAVLPFTGAINDKDNTSLVEQVSLSLNADLLELMAQASLLYQINESSVAVARSPAGRFVVNVVTAEGGQLFVQESENCSQSRSIMNSLAVGIVNFDPQWNAVFINPYMTEISGLGLDELSERGWVNLFNPDVQQQIADHFGVDGQNPEPFIQSFEYLTPLGRQKHFRVQIVSDINACQEVSGYNMVVSDFTNEALAKERLVFMASHDVLTSLYNRRGFIEQFRLLSQDEIERCVVAFIDVDDFKLLNDSKGHAFGDQILKAIAARINRCTKAEDILCRFGGDEFIVLAKDVTNYAEVLTIGQKLVATLSGDYQVGTEVINCECSVGVASAKEIVVNLDDEQALDTNDYVSHFIQAADAAMYMAKNSQLTNLYFFDNEVKKAQHNWLLRKDEYKKVIAEANYQFHFQPIYKNGELFSVEALLRLQGTNALLLGDFFSLLQEDRSSVHIYNQLTRAAIQGFAEIKQQFDSHQSLFLNVNVDLCQLTDHQFTDFITLWVTELGVKPEDIYVELTEQAIDGGDGSVGANLERLKAAGFRLSIDDFGAGYSTLQRLVNYSFDQLKIDRSLIMGLESSPKHQKTLEAIVNLSKGLDVELLAEGVEETEQYAFLKKLGIEVYQGYYFDRPMPASALLQKINKDLHANASR